MKKVGNMLLVANWDSDVGYAWWLMENFWKTIAEHIAEDGMSSFLIYPKITKIPTQIQKTDIHVLEHNFHNLEIKNLLKLRRIIKLNQIKYIYLTDYYICTWLYILLHAWGVKLIIVHDHSPGLRPTPSPIKRFIKSIKHRIPFYTADRFIAVTEFIRTRMLNVSCLPKRKCFCAPNGIIPYDSKQFDLTYANNKFNIPDDKIIVVTTGRATYYKGIDFFIACANEIINTQNNKQFHFIYCGDGPNINDFKTLVSNYNLDGSFTFAGKRNDIQNILPSCHIGLHTASGEVGYSLSILEYMSAGLITLVPDNPSTSLATENGVNGFIYKSKNIKDATSIILDYFNKKEEYTLLRKKAAQHVESQLNLNNTNKALERIIDSIIFNKSGV